MNPAEDDDFSHWDSLADELGLDSKPAQPAHPKPIETVKPTPSARPVSPAEVKQPTVQPKPTPEPEVESPPPVAEEADALESADTVLDEEASGESEGGEAETAEEGEGKGRRRRRRRRKKKGGGETPAAGGPTQGEDASAVPPPLNKPAPTSKAVPAVPPVVETSRVELLDDAPEELEDEGDNKAEMTSAMDEELTEETARPNPEWKVVSWTELVGSLYRPER